jgi:hypothetical protein
MHLGLVLVAEARVLEHQPLPRFNRCLRPGLEGLLRRANRVVNILLRCDRDAPKRLPSSWIDALVCDLTATLLAVDDVAEFGEVNRGCFGGRHCTQCAVDGGLRRSGRRCHDHYYHLPETGGGTLPLKVQWQKQQTCGIFGGSKSGFDCISRLLDLAPTLGSVIPDNGRTFPSLPASEGDLIPERMLGVKINDNFW